MHAHHWRELRPKDAREGLRPGACKGKSHRADNLGYAGRRVLVSRKWSGKTLADHRGDRKAWLLDMLGLRDPGDEGRPVGAGQPRLMRTS
jgi:hypothetical protein